jgi:ABC-2 type transport system permease protein
MEQMQNQTDSAVKEPEIKEKKTGGSRKKLHFDKQKFKNGFRTRAFKAGGYSTVASLAVVAIAVVIMLVVNRIPGSAMQLDITSNKLFTLSEQSKKIAAGLTGDITVYVIAQSGSEDQTLTSLLDQYEAASKHIQVETVDPVVSPNFLSQYSSDSVVENSVVVVYGERSRYISYDDIFETDYSSYYTTGTTSTDFNGENLITSAIDYVTSDDLPIAYQLQGHGENGLGSSAEDSIAGENIELEDLNLLTEDGVPDDCECLIIASPQTDITSDEKDTILSYLEDGGRMLLVTDYTETETPNLEALMEYYGVSRVDGIVVDGDGDYSLRGYEHYLLPAISTHTITEPLSGGNYYILMPIAQGLSVSDDLRDGLYVNQLLTTSDSAYSKLAGYDMTTYDKESGDIDGPFALGVAISEEVGTKETQIVWLTTSMMFDDTIDQMVSGANTDLLLNSLGWMCERENSISIRAKSLDSEQLVVSSAAASRWSIILVGVLPLAVILSGVVVVVRRKRK